MYDTLLRSKPDGIKGQFIKSATICTTMGPGIKLDLQEMEKLESKNHNKLTRFIDDYVELDQQE